MLNVVSDCVIVAMPIPVVLKLKMPIQDRVALVGIFLTGSLYMNVASLIH